MKFRPYNFRWIDQVPLSNLVRSTKNLRLYVEVSRILGPRALDGMRTDAASQLAFAAANTAAINQRRPARDGNRPQTRVKKLGVFIDPIIILGYVTVGYG